MLPWKKAEALSIANVLWFIFYAKNSTFFSLTHDLSHEILYAFGSVIKLICHFSIIFVEGGKKKKKHKENPAKRHLSSWWIIRVTSSLFKWNLKGLVKMITTIFHSPSSGRNIFFYLVSDFFLFLSSREKWTVNGKCKSPLVVVQTFFSVNFSHSWFSSICFRQVKLITGL